jgi:hypothetical protein
MSFTEMFGIVLIVVGSSALVALGVMHLGNLRNPDRVTDRQERREARALRKENAMPMWGHLVGWEMAWKRWRASVERVLGSNSEYRPRHARLDNEAPTAALQAAYVRKYRRRIVTIGAITTSMQEI